MYKTWCLLRSTWGSVLVEELDKWLQVYPVLEDQASSTEWRCGPNISQQPAVKFFAPHGQCREEGDTQVHMLLLKVAYICRYAHQKQQQKIYVMYVALIVIQHALCYARPKLYLHNLLAVQGTSRDTSHNASVCGQFHKHMRQWRLIQPYHRLISILLPQIIKTINSPLKWEAYTSLHMRNRMCCKTNDAMHFNHTQYNTSKHLARIASGSPTWTTCNKAGSADLMLLLRH